MPTCPYCGTEWHGSHDCAGTWQRKSAQHATGSRAAACAHGKDYPCRWPRCAEDGVCQHIVVSPFTNRAPDA